MSGKLLKKYSAVEGGFSYVGAVAAFLVVTVIYSFAVGALEEGSAVYEVVSFLFNILIQLCFFAAALLPARNLGSRMTYTFAKPTVRGVVSAAVLTVVCVVGFEGLALAFNYMLSSLGYTGGGIVSMAGALAIVFAVVRTVLAAPVCEELLLRGSVLSSLAVCGTMKRGLRIPFMVAVSGLMFALIHMNPQQAVYQFFFGCALAYVTIRFGSIVPAIIMHALNNAIGIVLSVPAVDGALSGWINGIFASGWGLGVFIAVSAALAVMAALVIRFVGRRFGGLEPESPEPHTGRTEDFENYADDGGTLAGTIMFIVGAVICLIMWVSRLVTGLGA